MANEQHVYSGVGPPVTAPAVIGAHYIDKSVGTEAVYLSAGISAVADWKLVGSGSGGGGGGVLTSQDGVFKIEIDAGTSTTPTILFDTAKPIVQILVADPTGVSVTFKIPTAEMPTDGENKGAMVWTIMLTNYSPGNFSLDGWVDSGDSSMTVLDGGFIATSTDNMNRLTLSSTGGSEYVLVNDWGGG